MKKLQKSDLKEGEIYVVRNYTGDSKYIVKINNNMDGCFNIYGCTNILYRNGNFSSVNLNYFEATPEEKHWLETCIKEDKFVSYEEAMKTFIPEYVECIILDSLIEVGKVYKTTGLKDWGAPYIDGCNKVYTLEIGNNNPYYTSQFKPSTKEAYDAQFVVKEPEFVLPEKWCVKVTNNNLDYFKSLPNYKTFNLGDWSSIIDINSACDTRNVLKKHKEITFEQFKKYVLKEDVEVLEEPKDKVLTTLQGKILEVESSEGGIFKIGDKITVFDKDSPNKGKPFTITGFRWNNAKTEICAGTEFHMPYGIRLSKIELYIEPKKELSLLEQAKLRYPICTKFIPTLRIVNKDVEISTGEFKIDHNNNIFSTNCNFTIYFNEKWAEIVEEVDDFVLPKKWCVEVTPDNQKFINSVRDRSCPYTYITSQLISQNIKNSWWCNSEAKHKGFTEITFEQFKKYVLNEKV